MQAFFIYSVTMDIYTLTSLGNSAILSAITAVAVLFLVLCRSYREALRFAAALAVTSVVITVLKIIFLSCGHNVFNIRSPSGHSGLSMAVYGSYALLLYRVLGGWSRYIVAGALLLVPLAIGVTRIQLHAHSLEEVILGTLVGLGCLAAVRTIIKPDQQHKLTDLGRPSRLILLLVLTFLAVWLVREIKLPTETILKDYAGRIKFRLAICQE